MLESIQTFLDGITFFSLDATQQLQMVGMWLIAAILLWLGVAKQFEPLLLVPIAFGALIANIPDNGMLITKVNKQIISVDEQGKMTETSFTDVGFLRINLAPLKTEIAPSEASKFASVEEQQKYDAAMASPMVATPVEKDGKIVAGKYDLKGQQGQNYVVTSISGGLYDWLGLGVKAEIFPPIIFLGVGALTDFGPLLAAPRTLLLGAAAQVGVAATIFLTMKLAPHLLGAVAVAAYTYMALVPLIQPPIMKLLTTKEQRKIKMKKLRDVSKGEKLFFAVLVTIVTILLIPDASPLLGMLMLGNFMRECGVTERLVKSAQNEITNIMTIFLGTAVGLTMQGERFLQTETIMIICLGIVAFGVATAGGLITAQIMNLIWRKNPVNPLIGSAGVSAVPMAARVSHNVGQKSDPTNYLLMHAMGPNVAGVIGTAVIAGYYIATLAH
jgi:oxaloacetate decarboxylase beta subunit